jgi:Sec-independent protein translocase protein TatA
MLFLASLLFNTSAMIVIALLVIILFTIKKLPSFFRTLSESVEGFRKVTEEFQKRLGSLQENMYWDQYDAEKTDVTKKWMRMPEESRPPFWNRRDAGAVRTKAFRLHIPPGL